MSPRPLNIHRTLVFVVTLVPMCLIGWLTGVALAQDWGHEIARADVLSWGVGIAVGVAQLAMLTCLGGHLAEARTPAEAWAAPARALRDMFRFLSLAVF